MIWTKDAAQVPLAAARVLKKNGREQEKARLDEKYEKLRAEYVARQETLVSLNEARENKLNLWK